MTSQLRSVLARLGAPRGLWRDWRADRRGATLVQFIAVMPVLILIVVGLWSLFQVYSAQQTLCEAVWSASRYLQVEGPYFEEGVDYPSGWVPVAVEIINTELKSNAMKDMQVEADDIRIFPETARIPPQEQSEVEYSVPNAIFFIRASVDIPNPLFVFFESGGDDPGTLRITCQKTGFYEVEPLRSTDLSRGEKPPTNCPPPVQCTAGPEPTNCVGPNCPTEDPCPCDP